MRLTLICAAAILGSTAATAQNSVLTLAGQQPAASPAKLASLTAPLPPSGGGAVFLGGGGNCATPTVIPPGPTTVNFPFDNTLPASAGIVTNPFEALCFHSGNTGIGNEEWWSWTATSTGMARLSTCTNQIGVDTKVAIYPDDCANITTAGAIACKDDDPACPNFETTVSWDITGGTTYLIQLGTFVGPNGAAPGGIGDFSIQELSTRTTGQYDSGTGTQNSLGLGAAGELMWLQVYDAGAGVTLNSVETAFGTAGLPIDPDGTPATIAIYAGDPLNGLTLLGTEPIVSANSATGLTTNYPLTTPIALTNLYTIGIHTTVTASSRPTPGDYTVNSFGRSWISWDVSGTPMNLVDPTSFQVPPAEVQFGLNGANDQVWVTRVHTTPSPTAFADFCSGDGGNQLGCTSCPCGNNAPAGTIGGCINSAGTATRISATGDPSASLPPGVTTDLRFTLSGAPAGAFCVMLSGSAVAPQNMANICFGLDSGVQSNDRDGLRCAVTSTKRHGGRSADTLGEIADSAGPSRVWGGEAQPNGGLWKQGGFTAGQTRYFQVTFRENPLAVCARGLNSSQAVEVMFTP